MIHAIGVCRGPRPNAIGVCLISMSELPRRTLAGTLQHAATLIRCKALTMSRRHAVMVTYDVSNPSASDLKQQGVVPQE